MTMLACLQFRGRQAGASRQILLVVVVGMLAGGCAAPPATMRFPVEAGLHLTRDHMLEFPLPVGWFDATADTQAAGHGAWLLKDDYTASITIDEIALDEGAREAIGGKDLLRLSELVMSLMASNRSASADKPPSVETVNGSAYSFFELHTIEEEVLRVAVLDTGEHAYTITLYEARGRGSGEEREAFLISFLEGLRRQ